jgi:hypothetical protein
VAQRIVRAKRTLAEAHVPFEVPGEADCVSRPASVLEVIYLIFNLGYAATAGEDWVWPPQRGCPALSTLLSLSRRIRGPWSGRLVRSRRRACGPGSE